MPTDADRRPIARMWPPAARWREHVCMLVVRDTRGCALEPREQLNRFPANPYCCITWLLQGEVELLAQGDDARRLIVEAFLAEHATALRGTAWTRLRRMGVNVGLRLAGGLLGVGPRQVQRLARREGGMSVPELSRLWRGERSLRTARARLASGQALDWSEHALDAGYADQSHFVRDCKAMSGRTPTQIVQQARDDEADWIYRL